MATAVGYAGKSPVIPDLVRVIIQQEDDPFSVTGATTGTGTPTVTVSFDDWGIKSEARTVSSAATNTPALPAVSAKARLILPVESIDIKENIEHIIDENIRGRFGRDFEAYGGKRMVEGSISGNFYPGSDATETALHSPQGHMLKVLMGGDYVTALPARDFYRHSFFVTPLAASMHVEVQDNLNFLDGTTTPVYAGVMLEKMTFKYDAGGSLFTWDADLKGRRQYFVDTATTAKRPEKELTGEALVGWESSVNIGDDTANPSPTLGTVLSAEISVEREIEMKVTSGDDQTPTIRAVRPPRVMFTAVVELTDYDLYKKYSDDTAGKGTAAADGRAGDFNDFTLNQEAWTFRFATKRGIGTATTDAQLTAATSAGGLDDSDGVFDVRIHNSSYGESPVTISRSENSNTFEFSARGLLVEDPTLFGSAIAASTTLPSGSTILPPGFVPNDVRLGTQAIQIALINKRALPY